MGFRGGGFWAFVGRTLDYRREDLSCRGDSGFLSWEGSRVFAGRITGFSGEDFCTFATIASKMERA